VNEQDDIKMVYCDCCQNWYHKCLHVDGKGAYSITHDEGFVMTVLKSLFSDDSN